MAGAGGDDFSDDSLYDGEFQDPGYFAGTGIQELTEAMIAMFPSVDRRKIHAVINEFGSDSERVVDELLRKSPDPTSGSSSGHGLRERTEELSSEQPVRQPPLKQRKYFKTFDYEEERLKMKMKVEAFQNFLPDADPDYLREKAIEFGDDQAKIQEWLENAMQDQAYPTLLEFLKRKEFRDILENYGNMSAPEFMALVPGAADFYRDRNRPVSDLYKTNTATFLRMLFPNTEESLVDDSITHGNNLLFPCVNYLSALGCGRGPLPNYDAFVTNEALDLTFIQEMTFLRLETEIENAASVAEIERKFAFDEAKAAGNLLECPVCCEDEVMITDVRECSEDHMFCTSCVRRQAEIAAAEAHPRVGCLESGCDGFFPLSQLCGLLTPSLFAALLRQVQQRELESAAVDGLEACPFCAFGIEIEDPKVTVFKCLNPLCRMDTCRKCKRPDHSPVPCDKVEDDDQVKARLLLEEKLTLAIVRQCPKCKKEVVKDEGCNLMHCPCGYKFCYACRKQVDGYGHFNLGQCQQWVVAEEIHRHDLSRAVAEGRTEVIRQFGDVKLVHDPTKDIDLS